MKLKYLSLLTFIIALLMLTTINVKADGFNASREITNNGAIINNTFTYTVTNGSSNPATVTIPGTVTISFSSKTPSSGSATQTSAPLISENAWLGVDNWPGTSTKLNYTKPGTYTFIVTETASTNATIYPLDTNTYTVTIFVANNLNANNEPDGTFTKTYIASVKTGTSTKITKTGTAPFTKAANRAYLQITKKVTGNAADATKCFQMTITLSGYINSEVYNITGSSCSTGTNNVTSVTMPSSGTTAQTIKVQLKHNDVVKIGYGNGGPQLPVNGTNTKYTIAETAETGYTTYINGSSTAATSTGEKTLSTTQSSNNYTFRNDKQETTPTGIIIRTLPFLILIALSVIGVVAILKTKKLEEDIQ
ncbi:MAG: hypothetical protein IJI43_01795 [Bacilli bacterium]|nr:hypothetical protein [Bacilli bacterium]